MSNLKSFACPTCNAPLAITGNETEVRCQFCGNVVIVPDELRTPAPSVSDSTPQPISVVMPTQIVTPISTSSSGCGLLVPLIGAFAGIVAGIIGIVVAITASSSHSTLPPIAPALSTAAPTATSAVSLVITFGGEGTGAGKLTNPTEFAVDSKGYVYVSDRDTGLITRFDPEGNYMSQWQVDPKAKYGPTCLTADHAGNVYACGNSGLLKFDGATGKRLATFTGDPTKYYSFRSGARALLDGNVLVYESVSDEILEFDKSGKVVNHTDKISEHLDGKDTFNVDIIADDVGNIFALETRTYYILAYKPDGTFVTRFGGQTEGRAVDPSRPEKLWNTLTIAVDSASHIFAEDLDALKVFDHDGHYLTSYPLPSAANRPSLLHMGFDDANDLYALGRDKDIYKIYKFRLSIYR